MTTRDGSTTKTREGRRYRALPAAAVLLLLAPGPATAWIWPEHRDIAAEALRTLPSQQRQTLDAMWAETRALGGKQLCARPVDPGAQPATKYGDWDDVCIDLAALPALAADHSCAAGELWSDASKAQWAVKVVWVAARTKERLAAAKDPAQLDDAWNLSHLAMQYVDPRYLTRAEGNNAHFLIPRAAVQDREDLDGYLDRVLAPTAEINATGLYAEYHMLGLRLAALWHSAPASEKPDLARRALFAEGVALHFLEDSFSSGHYAATWGTAAWQKGTHDLYSTIGLTTMTWSGDLFASHGDAHMTHRDMEVAAATVRRSYAQLASAAEGRLPLTGGALAPRYREIEALDFCKAAKLPPAPDDDVARGAVAMVLQSSPVPAGGPNSIHPPRARAEMGPFVGAISGYGLGTAFGGYDSWANTRLRSEFEIGARFGYGLEGLLTTNMDGQIWAQAEFVSDPVQLDLGCSTCAPYPAASGKRTDPAVPRVGSRSSLKLALRMPYYVVPFDLVVLAPVLLLTSPEAAQQVVFASAGGGLLRLQRRIETGIGSFQFMAGRELGLTLWGYAGQVNQFVASPTPDPLDSPVAYQIVNYRSLEWDFPVLEYVPPRVFATSLSLAAVFQLGFSVEFPQKGTVKETAVPYQLGPSWLVYLRFRLDARKYFGGSEDALTP